MQIASPLQARPQSFSQRRIRRPLVALAASTLLLPLPLKAADDLRPAEQDVLQGRVDQAVAKLQPTLGRDPGNATGHLLLCRALLSELHGADAANECRQALKAGLANDSSAQDWAGRAFGAEAEHAGPISGLKLAGQVRTAFHTAYQLNRTNPAAANDLGEYFINAPSIVGGGAEKASALAEEIQATLPEIAHRLRALLAEKHGDPGTAEREFIASTQVAQSPGAYVDLACFYSRQGAMDKATAAARRSIALNRRLDSNMVDAAGCLSDVHQPGPAMDALRAYLDRGQQSDAAPVFRAHTMLGDLLAGQGDKLGARREYQAALALTAGYAPARKGLAAL